MKLYGKILTIYFCLLKSIAYSDINFIAHAGGGYNGYNYTNSVEAIEKSIDNKFKFIELDLRLTKDKFFYGFHNWSDLEIIDNLKIDQINKLKKKQKLNNLTIEDIKSFNLAAKIKIITEEQIIKIFNQNPNLILVTDKSQDFYEIEKLSLKLQKRVYVEIRNKYNFVKSYFFNLEKRLLYTNLSFTDILFIKIFNIKNLVISKQDFLYFYKNNKKLINKLIRNDTSFYIFTVNNEKELQNLINISKNIYVYTDELKPKN